MYVPKYHEQTDTKVAQSLIEAFPLGAWVSPGVTGLIANHIPFLLDRSRGKFGALLGHVSRANPIWHQFSTSEQSVVLFQGPQVYISPSWYPSKAEHGKVVPTWNYSVVHAYGVPRAIENEEWLLDLLSRLTDVNEFQQKLPWKIADAPIDFITKLLRAVVGIEIPIECLIGKLKVSQDEALQDRRGTVDGLQAKGDENALAMAILVQQQLDKGAGM